MVTRLQTTTKEDKTNKGDDLGREVEGWTGGRMQMKRMSEDKRGNGEGENGGERVKERAGDMSKRKNEKNEK